MTIKKYPIEIELTNLCGLQCKYCINKDLPQKGFMDEVLFSRVLEYLYVNRKNILYINLSGIGDIFLHPKINQFLVQIIQQFSGTGMKILIATKGNFLSETALKILSHAQAKGVHFILSFGIFSMNPVLHDAFVKKKGALKKTIKMIFLAKKYKVDVSLELLFSSYARDTVLIYKNFCEKIQLSSTLHSIHNFGGRIDISHEEVISAKNFCSFSKSGEGENFFYENFSKCRFIPFVDYRGRWFLCSLNAHSDEVLYSVEAYFHVPYIELVQEFPRYMRENCKKCSLNL